MGRASAPKLRASLVVIALSCPACASTVPLPPKAIALNLAGARAIEEGDLAVAAASLSVALEYSPRFVEAWVNLGYVELGRGNLEQAHRDFLRARELNQDIPVPHHALGLLAEREGRGDRAEGHYRAALRVDPGFAPARANLARVLFGRGWYESAREEFERLIQVAPDMVEGWAGEAETLRELGRGAQADDVIARAREKLGDLPSLALLAARQQLERGEWKDAEATLAPLLGGVDRARAGAAWAWIAVARAGAGDRVGAQAAAHQAQAIDRNDQVAGYVLSLSAETGSLLQQGPRSPRRR